MDMKKIQAWIARFGVPVLMVVLGLILLAKPDTAAVLVSKVIGWVMILLGAGYAISTAKGDASTPPTRWVTAAVEIIAGIIFVTRPLFLAEAIFRCLGALLAVRAFIDIQSARRFGVKWPKVPVITMVCGVLLLLTPLSVSRILVRIAGLVILVLGAANFMTQKKQLPGGDKPDIIDAE